MFGTYGLCAVAVFAYVAASRKPLMIVSLIDNEPMTKNGRFDGGGEADRIEEFKAEIVTPRIKIWNSEDMVLHVVNNALQWERNSNRDSALWTYVPVNNEGGMLSVKGGQCLFRDEDLVSLRECPKNPNSLISEYMFKLDMETNPNDLKRCERVVIADREERIRKREAGDVGDQRGGGPGIRDRELEPGRERADTEPKRGARDSDGRTSAIEGGGRRREPQYPRNSIRQKYENREYPRPVKNDRDTPGEQAARSPYRYSEREPRGGEYTGRPMAPERGPQEDSYRRDFDVPERGDRYFDKELRGESINPGKFSRGGGGNYRGGAKDRGVPGEQGRDYNRPGPSISCKDDPLSCGMLPENSRKLQQGGVLDENALSTLIQLIKKFQQERINGRSDSQRAQSPEGAKT